MLQNGLFLTGLADAIFFCFCVVVYRVNGCLKRRRRRLRSGTARPNASPRAPTSEEPGAPMAPIPSEEQVLSVASGIAGVDGRPLLTPEQGEDEEQDKKLNTTARNYIAFLRNSFWVFLVLSLISIPMTSAIWGTELTVEGESLHSIRRTLFNSTGRCVSGFPDLGAEGLSSCMSRSSQSRPDNWVYYEPHENATSDSDPRPRGYYMEAFSLHDCKHTALVCGAPAMAYGRTAKEHEEGRPGECWLFATVASSTLPLKGFTHCQGEQDFLPGQVEFVLTLVYGLVVFIFTIRLLCRMSSSRKGLFESSAVWLTELPRADREDGELFWLDNEDFNRVARDLKVEIEAHLDNVLSRENVNDIFVNEEKVQGVCVLHQANEAPSCWSRFRGTANLAIGRRGSLISGELPTWGRSRTGSHWDAKKRMAGHAFVIMKREAYVDALLASKTPLCGCECLRFLPSYIRRRDYTLFKFGVPPWSAVTLRCQRAPPASDIIWKNLHFTWRETIIKRRAFEMALFVFSLSLVAPVSFASSGYAILDNVNQNTEGVVKFSPRTMQMLGELVDKLPSYFLLLINSVLLPTMISWMSDVAKPHLRSRAEATQFRSNLLYLLLNSFLVPLLGFLTTSKVSILEQIVAYFSQLSKEDATAALQMVGEQTLQAPSELLLKYTMNAAFITTGCQLFQPGHFCAMCVTRNRGLTFPFPWGYWYAFCMSLLVISLCMSVVMPVIVVLAAIFFAFMHRVHRECFKRGVFDLKFEMDGDAELAIVCWMIRGVGMFWILMGFFFYSQPSNGIEHITLWQFELPVTGTEKLPVPFTNFTIPAKLALFIALILLAMALWVVSWLFGFGGMLEKGYWRRCGPGGLCLLRNITRLLSLMTLVAAVLHGPGVVWVRHEVPYQHAAAMLLWLLALVVILISGFIKTVMQRRAKSSSWMNLHDRLNQGRQIPWDELMKEYGMEGIAEMRKETVNQDVVRMGRLDSRAL